MSAMRFGLNLVHKIQPGTIKNGKPLVCQRQPINQSFPKMGVAGRIRVTTPDTEAAHDVVKCVHGDKRV